MVNPDMDGLVSVGPDKIIQGRFDLSGQTVLVGSVLARMLDVSVGDKLAIYSVHQLEQMEDSQRSGKSEVRPAANLEVAGIFDVGFYEYNATLLVTSLADAQDFQGLVVGDEDYVSGLYVKLKNSDEATTIRVADDLRQTLKADLEVITWMEDNGTLLGAVAVRT